MFVESHSVSLTFTLMPWLVMLSEKAWNVHTVQVIFSVGIESRPALLPGGFFCLRLWFDNLRRSYREYDLHPPDSDIPVGYVR